MGAAGLGLLHEEIHEARLIRDAEQVEPAALWHIGNILNLSRHTAEIFWKGVGVPPSIKILLVCAVAAGLLTFQAGDLRKLKRELLAFQYSHTHFYSSDDG